MWHAKTAELQKQGRLQVAGIIQEQHPDRARLFMQWKELEWPILVDSLNLLGVSAVPITLLIDEQGVIRSVQPKDQDLEQFLQTNYSAASGTTQPRDHRFAAEELIRSKPEREAAADIWRTYADASFLWRDGPALNAVIDAYLITLEKEPEHAPTHFRLGVAYRARHDSAHRRPGDFQNAVEAWKEALDRDLNQYIWRRRIQQYGPRLDKPYPFYNWVETARKEIEARGEKPVALTAEPSGAEIASPIRDFQPGSSTGQEPDPEDRITRDLKGFVHVEITTVPPRVEPGEHVRVHVRFDLNEAIQAHWNNEVDGLALWLNPLPGLNLQARLLSLRNPPQPVSSETRSLEFELKVPADASAGAHELAAYALYYVCEDVNGQCLYRRQDMRVPIRIGSKD